MDSTAIVLKLLTLVFDVIWAPDSALFIPCLVILLLVFLGRVGVTGGFIVRLVWKKKGGILGCFIWRNLYSFLLIISLCLLFWVIGGLHPVSFLLVCLIIGITEVLGYAFFVARYQ